MVPIAKRDLDSLRDAFLGFSEEARILLVSHAYAWFMMKDYVLRVDFDVMQDNKTASHPHPLGSCRRHQSFEGLYNWNLSGFEGAVE